MSFPLAKIDPSKPSRETVKPRGLQRLPEMCFEDLRKSEVFPPSGSPSSASAEVTLNGGLVRELPPKSPKHSGLGIILICPDWYSYGFLLRCIWGRISSLRGICVVSFWELMQASHYMGASQFVVLSKKHVCFLRPPRKNTQLACKIS